MTTPPTDERPRALFVGKYSGMTKVIALYDNGLYLRPFISQLKRFLMGLGLVAVELVGFTIVFALPHFFPFLKPDIVYMQIAVIAVTIIIFVAVSLRVFLSSRRERDRESLNPSASKWLFFDWLQVSRVSLIQKELRLEMSDGSPIVVNPVYRNHLRYSEFQNFIREKIGNRFTEE